MFAPGVRSLWIVPSHIIGAGRVVAALMVLIAWLRGGNRIVGDPSGRAPAPGNAIPLHEMVSVTLLAAIPAFLIILLTRLHSPIFYRYGLVAVLGMAILITWAWERAACADSRVGVVILLVLTGVFVERFVSDAWGTPDQQPLAKVMDDASPRGSKVPGQPLLEMAPGNLPLVVANPIWFPAVVHYAPPELAMRTYYLTDSDAARKFTGTNFFEIALPVMLRFHLPGHVVPYSAFQAEHRRFLVYTSSNEFDWLMGRLRPDHATFKFLGRMGDAILLEACLQCQP